MTTAPVQCDYLEIKPGRRIRVVHRFGKQVAAGAEESGNAAMVVDCSSGGGGGAAAEKDSDDEEDEYWFENAAPNRLPIQQPPPGHRMTTNRIFNKFEPQEPPRIPGINPPRASGASAAARGGATGDAAASSACAAKPQDLISPGRLPRKTILTEGINLDDDDDDDSDTLVLGRRHGGDDEADRSEEIHRPVNRALTNVSEFVLGITADSTNKPTVDNTLSSPESLRKQQRSPSIPNSSLQDLRQESSPKPDNKTVLTIPDPGETSTDSSVETHEESHVTVIVTGGHLGGMANPAFQDDSSPAVLESTGPPLESQTPSPPPPLPLLPPPTDDTAAASAAAEAATPAAVDDAADAGYVRNRNLSEFIDQQDVTSVLTSAPAPPNASDHLSQAPNGSVTEIPLSPLPNGSAASNGVSPAVPVAAIASAPAAAAAAAAKPVLFFLHGVGGSADSWNAQIKFFVADGFEVIAPDLLGHGFSSAPDHPKKYTFPKLLRDILTIFDHYLGAGGGGGRRCALIAHAYGCSFAAAVARTRPENVAMLIMAASGGGAKRQQKYNPRGKSIRVAEALHVPAYVHTHIMAGQQWPEGDASFHRRITCPTLLVYGLKDSLVSLVEMCEMERTIPRAFLELLPLAGHQVMCDEPKQFSVMIKKFIQKYTPTQ